MMTGVFPITLFYLLSLYSIVSRIIYSCDKGEDNQVLSEIDAIKECLL